MNHSFNLTGKITEVRVNEPKDPKKSPSAILLLQYGPPRDTTSNAVEFVNATLVRVPPFQYPKVKDLLVAGKVVCISGHLQGVLKTYGEEAAIVTELVADRLTEFPVFELAAD